MVASSSVAHATAQPSGLAEAEAQARLRAEGFNDLPSGDRRTFLKIIVEVLREPMFALLLGAGAIYLVLGDLTEATLLLAFATVSVAITVVQETRSERVLDALRDVASPRALVIRDGQRRRIPGREVVRGDAIVLLEGDRIPADAVLAAANGLLIDESLLTGESIAVHKANTTGEVAMARPGGENTPFVYSGTLVLGGDGLAIVRATGLRSELGQIGQALQKIAIEPPRLQIETRQLVRVFAVFGLAASLLVIVLYGLVHGDWLQAVLAGIALGMSMLPEEFPLVLTAFMVMGAWRMSRARVLTRRAAAIEMLGAATVLCTDKTGTLTENRMTVAELRSPAGAWRREDGETPADELALLIEAALLASALEPSEPMEKAIGEVATLRSGGSAALYDGTTIVRQYGLQPHLLAMTNVWSRAGELRVMTKGAPETIATLCRLDGTAMCWLRRTVDEMAQDGIRVLGVGEARPPPGDLPESQASFDLRFLGLVGFADPLRANVPAAIGECRSAGVRVLMITGDYPATARAIAAQAGLDVTSTIDGAELAGLDHATLRQRLGTTNVFARIMPEQKLRIVEALKANGEIVAMTGDGVNDAPALKAAHIGIAMGGRGTDVAREASSIVLLDDDFGSIVHTIRLGRRIYDNLRKASAYIVAVHVPIAGLALLPLLFGLPFMLTPVHIAFLEMVIDPACSIAFEAEPAESDIMHRPPRRAESRLLSLAIGGWSLLQGGLALTALAAVLFAGVARGMPEDELRALMFTSLVLINVSLILVNRSFSSSLVVALRRPNAFLWYLLAAVAAVLTVALTWPPAMALFRFGPLHADDLAVSAAAGLAVLLVTEVAKPLWRASFRS
ncbi:HAD-IC family P-type ATPase [soil metagenome]